MHIHCVILCICVFYCHLEYWNNVLHSLVVRYPVLGRKPKREKKKKSEANEVDDRRNT